MQTRRNAMIGGLSLAAGLGLSSPSRAAPKVFTKYGFALGGYDSAAYWTAQKAAMAAASAASKLVP